MSPRSCRSPRKSTRARRSSAARRVFVAVGNKCSCLVGDCPLSHRSAGLRRLLILATRTYGVALTKVRTLRFSERSRVFPIKNNASALRK